MPQQKHAVLLVPQVTEERFGLIRKKSWNTYLYSQWDIRRTNLLAWKAIRWMCRSFLCKRLLLQYGRVQWELCQGRSGEDSCCSNNRNESAHGSFSVTCTVTSDYQICSISSWLFWLKTKRIKEIKDLSWKIWVTGILSVVGTIWNHSLGQFEQRHKASCLISP